MNNIKTINIKDLNGYRANFQDSQMQIISDLGCNLNKLILAGQNILDGNLEYESLKNNELAKSSFLIPFPNRICDGKYVFEGKTYQLEKNHEKEGHAIHGLIFDKKFSLINKMISDDFIFLIFKYEIKKSDFEGYPFNLFILITFKLEKKRLGIEVKATNLDNINVPYGVGWHPYIRFTDKIDNYSLALSSDDALEVSQEKIMIPTSKIIKKYIDKKIGNTVLDAGFTCLKKHMTQIGNIIVFQDESMDFLQIYTPGHRRSIAIEPMSCAADAFNNKMGLVALKPGEGAIHRFGIIVSL